MNKNNNNLKKKYYYAFFDAEYTCFMEKDTFFDREHSGELLSVGLVICDKSFTIVQTYYSPIHPFYNSKLTGYCRELTGLTQKEIDEAPAFETVFQEIYLLLQQYPVKEIFTWGNDAHTIRHDMEKNHRYVAKRFRKIAGLLQDITKRLTRRVYGKGMTISLSDMKYICGMDRHTAHNALEDARDLYQITCCCLQGKYDQKKAQKLQTYLHDRDMYHQYKRFKKPLAFTAAQTSVSEKGKTDGEDCGETGQQSSERMLKDISMQYIDVLKTVYGKKDGSCPAAILALCDDIRSLVGMETQDCPRLE